MFCDVFGYALVAGNGKRHRRSDCVGYCVCHDCGALNGCGAALTQVVIVDVLHCCRLAVIVGYGQAFQSAILLSSRYADDLLAGRYCNGRSIRRRVPRPIVIVANYRLFVPVAIVAAPIIVVLIIVVIGEVLVTASIHTDLTSGRCSVYLEGG